MRVKRLLCSILALAMVLSTMGTVVFADSTAVEITADYTAKNGDVLTGGTGVELVTIEDDATVTLSGVNVQRITLKGDATINLADGTTNNVNTNGAKDGAVVVPKGGSLTINGSTGILNATRNGYMGNNYNAAIGSDKYNNGSVTITINGGVIYAESGYGAAIGGGQDMPATVEINGGTINAKSNYAAAIGGGQDNAGTVTISNGTLTAESSYGAAIGGGQNADAAVTITGGNITAQGMFGTAIGAGQYSAGTTTVSITDATVSASVDPATASSNPSSTRGLTSAAIGASKGTATVTITDSTVSAISVNAPAIGGGIGAGTASVTISGDSDIDVSVSAPDYEVENAIGNQSGDMSANVTIDDAVEVTEQRAVAKRENLFGIGQGAYFTIADAVAAAASNDVITILAGTYDGFTVPTDKNNLTFIGETDAEGKNLVTIKTLEEGIESHNGGIFVQAETTTFKNLNFTAGTVAGAKSGWMSASLGNTNGDTGMRSSLKNLTVENCNFTGSGEYQAIWTNQGNITLKNSTITNYSKGIDNYAIGAEQKVVIEDSEITDVYNAFHTGEAKAGAQIVVTGTEIDSDVIDIGGAVAVSVEESTIKNAAVTAYASSTINISESALYDTTYAVYEGATGSVTLDAVYANNVNELAAIAKAENIAFSTYYQAVADLGTGNTVTVPTASDAIYVKFEDVTATDAEGEKLYNINLVATDEEIINRLNSADLTFDLDVTEGNVAYEIIASNSEVAVNPVDNSEVRYEFHYNGKDGVTTDSANTITIGQVKFEGYGEFDFVVDATADTNVAHATTVADNIVDTFIPNGNIAAGEGKLDISDDTITDVVIAVPTRELTINIDFPNAVVDNEIAYQDMKVEITGNIDGVNKTVTYNLGEDEEAMADGDYVVTEDKLVLNNAYTVTVSGAGYRTARYTVTMTDDKQLNFWNNVKDEAQVVEVDKDSSVAKVTFLAGDIVKDNNINIYDLSAVVSYFGTEELVEKYPEYAKYDLNRDGVIDSKDVAYVLVSWGK